MVRKRTDHYLIGYSHCMAGMERYKFYDPYLQGLYDEGWQDAANGRELEQSLLKRVQQLGRKERW